MESLECDVCCHHYDEDERQPRTLSCGHTLCSVCVTNGISESQLKCPFCRRVYSVNTYKDIPVSFTLLRVMRMFKAMGNEPLPAMQQFRAAQEPEMHAGLCAEHGAYKLFSCTKCQEWICRECTVVEHPTGTCTVVSVKVALSNMKRDEDKLVQSSEVSMHEQVTAVNNYMTELSEFGKKHDEHKQEFQKLIKKQMEAKRQLEGENERFCVSLHKGAAATQKITTANIKLQQSNTVEGVTEAFQESQQCRNELEKWVKESKYNIAKADVRQESEKIQREMQHVLRADGLLNDPFYASSFASIVDSFWKSKKSPEKLSINDLKFIVQFVPIWAKHENSSFAKISLEDGTLHLHALRKTSPPSKCIIIPYWCVRSLIRKPVEVFLGISWGNMQRGSVYIATANEDHVTIVTPFLKRCSGEDCNSFVNSRMHQVLDKSDHIKERLSGGGGDYGSLCVINEPMRSLSSFSRLVSSTNTRNWVTRCTLNSVEGFSIWLTDSIYKANSQMYYTLGRVTKGMEIVKETSNYHNVRAVSINYCGLLIKGR